MAIKFERTEKSGVMGRVFGRETVVHQEFLKPGQMVALGEERRGTTKVTLITTIDDETAKATTSRLRHGLTLPQTEEQVLKGRAISLRSPGRRVSFVPQES